MRAWPSPSLPTIPEGKQRSVLVRDTQSGEVIEPAVNRRATMYVCGITPYDATHMGHAATYIAFDLLNRIWRDSGKSVTYVQNITDIDDPLLERAEATGVNWEQLAEREIALFRDDMAALRILPPEHYIGVVESIPLVIESIDILRRNNTAYEVDGDLYFDVHSDSEYGTRSHLSEEEQLRIFAERGGDPDRPGKRNRLDALLWMRQRGNEPSWDSPWGKGRPGWHIECCSIGQHYLKVPTMDVKGGGSDLIFPHHEMSAAQARIISGQPFARAFVHTGMIGLDGEKMSKSRGNLVFVSSLRHDGVDPMAIRLALMSNHYRENRDWSSALLASAEARLATWRSALARMGGAPATPVIEEIREALSDDLDSPRALSHVDEWAQRTLGNEWEENGELGLMSRALDALLGLAL